MKYLKYAIYCITILIFIRCENSAKNETVVKSKTNKKTLFTLQNPDSSGLSFVNEVKENEKLNIFTYEYLYNGSGVAIGDINNDGLQDVFLGGNYFGGRLFLNKGNLKFEQISEKAGVFCDGFTTGITMVDINKDGWIDIYLCRSVSDNPELRANVLLINNKNNTFTNKAKEYGLDDKSFSNHANFFDYDNDGDLDMYLLNHRVDFKDALTLDYSKTPKKDNILFSSDKLYRNNGDLTFTDVTNKSGIANTSFGLSATVSDINNDGWADIYISCDYADKDHLYINNKNGTFSDVIESELFHISKNSMGSDIADINNDGLMDIMTLDMVSEDNYRQKLLKGQSPYDLFHLAKSFNLHYQLMRNCLQLNNGNGSFSEIAQLAGISHTDWSWSPLIADFDNDGYKDIHITNGYYHDVTDLDYIKYASNLPVIGAGGFDKANKFDLIKQMKQTPINNYIYKNNGDLTFSNNTQSWGINTPSFSNGSAYADLDGDGDLEIIVNNFNQPAFLYKNNSRELYPKNNFISFKFKVEAEGAKIWVITDGSMQVQEQRRARGFLSSLESRLHFGVGKAKIIEKIIVKWPNNKMQVFNNINANQTIVLDNKDANSVFQNPDENANVIEDITHKINFPYTHKENVYNDFKHEPLLEQMYSNTGPYTTKGDVDGDDTEDIYIGGASNQPGALFRNNKNGFSLINPPDIIADKEYEDTGCLLFDCDGDKDLDLYVASGSNEIKDTLFFQDRLYLNDGKGNFKSEVNRLPKLYYNSTCVKSCDFDQDGDLDLFIGGGVIPGRYPVFHPSILLENKSGYFSDRRDLLPKKGLLGIVTDAEWEDIVGNDNKKDLLIIGHWTDIQLLQNSNSKFNPVNSFEKTSGWWNCICKDDFDNDGDIDFVVGNRGLNSFYKASVEHPAHLFYQDFDSNGSIDPIPAYYFNDFKLYPKHTMDELFTQLPLIRKKYNSYFAYAKATINDIFPDMDKTSSSRLILNNFATSYFENLGGGKFKPKPLPNLAQVSIAKDIISEDINADGFNDLIIVGNQYGADVEMGRYDSSIGTILINTKKGEFEILSPVNSGLKVIGDTRKIITLNHNKNKIFIILKNNNTPQILKTTNIKKNQ
ncbi:MAG: VCBS repeat-containing protein [Bacteroidota bacterium]|nr:VCBS repeat-containing protein [Bacteroidota bacterium]